MALTLGIVVEAVSYYGRFYSFHPWWLVIAVILIAFGFIFATLAMMLRRKSSFIQFICGVLAAAIIESVNVLGLLPNHYWVFSEGWPLGITNPWIRTAVLSIPGGIFILVLNLVQRSIYKNRLRLRGDR